MKKRALGVLALLIAGCGPGLVQQEPGSLVSPLALEPPPVYSLIGHRESLELTSEQIVALDSIAQAVREENAPVVAQLREQAQAQSRRARGAIIVNEQTRPLLEEVRDRNREAVQAVQELLTPEQETEVCRLFDLERRNRERTGATRAPRRPQPAAADTTLFRPGPVWTWCVPAAANG